ncbi:MAG: hypothetical protein ACLFTK_14175 [Anaerolineales bacterium]
MTLALCKDDIALEFFFTITTFGTAIDATVQELRIESLYAATPATHDFISAL